MLHLTRANGIHLFTTPTIENCQVVDYLGIVQGCSIQGIHMFKDYTAYLADKFGGRVGGYESSMRKAVEEAVKDMVQQAEKLGANGIIGVDIDTGNVNNRMLMATCYGTAIRFKKKAS